MTLILASASAAKLAILRGLGLDVEAIPHEVDESAFDLGPDPASGVRRLAEAKALSVSRGRSGEDLVIGADQMLWFEGRLHGKVASAGEAQALLERLQGRRHRLLAGWALARADRVAASGVEPVDLTVRALTPAQVRRYVETGEWRGSAGCYRIEGVGRQLFAAVEGDHYAVLGMPVASLLAALRQAGAPGLI
jgi:septum formation protein